MQIVRKAVQIICVAILLIAFVPASYAALSLNVNSADGGGSLRLGRVDGAVENSKAVKIRISTNDGKQYQVFSRLAESIVNERQNILDAQAVQAYALSGSNATGTLYSQPNEPLSFSDQLFYTSSPDGQSDTFTIVYSVDPKRMNASGNFMGRIVYTVRSLGGGGQDEVFLNIYLEASGALKVEVKGATNSDSIRLECNHRSNKNDSVRLSFSGNVGDEIKVYQEVLNFPQDEVGKEIEAGAIQFSTAAARGELYHLAPEVIDHKKILLYKSKEAEDDFTINFDFNPESLPTLKAGTYRGRLNLIIESAQGQNEFPLNVEIKVDPIFEVNVQLPPEGVKFAHILPTDPPQIQEVGVEVKTNLGKPYMVIQNVATALTNEKGEEIKKDFFTMKVDLLNSSAGKIAAGDFVSIRPGEMPVFYSDSKGSPANFKISYRLRSYPEIAAGDYAAPIVFSLGEM